MSNPPNIKFINNDNQIDDFNDFNDFNDLTDNTIVFEDGLFCDTSYTTYSDTEDVINTNDICTLCGLHIYNHFLKTHRFIKIKENYRCKKCKLFFYQHNHKDCHFTPTNYITP